VKEVKEMIGIGQTGSVLRERAVSWREVVHALIFLHPLHLFDGDGVRDDR
jgi:hypothetical protein